MKNSYDWWMVIKSFGAKALSVIGVLWLWLISSYILHTRSCACCRSSNGCTFMSTPTISYLLSLRLKMLGQTTQIAKRFWTLAVYHEYYHYNVITETSDVNIMWVGLKGILCPDYQLIRKTNAPWHQCKDLKFVLTFLKVSSTLVHSVYLNQTSTDFFWLLVLALAFSFCCFLSSV